MQRKDLRQLAQRITSRFHLQPLSKNETKQYIKHRLSVSGGAQGLFSDQAISKIFNQTQGVPRLINVLCDRALLVAFAKESHSVGTKHVRQAIAEVYPDQKNSTKPWLITAFVLLLTLPVFFYWFYTNQLTDDTNEFYLPIDNAPTPEYSTTLNVPSAAVSWQQYLSLWGADQSLIWNQNRCPEVITIGMGCLRKQGNLTQIQKQNTPVLLELNQGQLALVTAINSDQVTLVTTTGKQSFENSFVNQQWYGHYFVLWPMASELIDDTISSTVNEWALNVAKVIDNNPDLPNAELNDWIINFQLNNGLLADGIIGKETQMALSLKAYKGPNLIE